MNKKMMILLAGLIAVGPVVQVAASVDAMFYDIKNIVEDKLTGQNDYDRLHNIQNALHRVKQYKRCSEDEIIDKHARVDHEKTAGLFFGALSGLFFGASAMSHYSESLLFIKQDTAPLAAIGLIFAAGSVFGICKKKIDLYYNKKKINELNVIILRLEAMEKTLTQKLYPCGYCGY